MNSVKSWKGAPLSLITLYYYQIFLSKTIIRYTHHICKIMVYSSLYSYWAANTVCCLEANINTLLSLYTSDARQWNVAVWLPVNLAAAIHALFVQLISLLENPVRNVLFNTGRSCGLYLQARLEQVQGELCTADS